MYLSSNIKENYTQSSVRKSVDNIWRDEKEEEKKGDTVNTREAKEQRSARNAEVHEHQILSRSRGDRTFVRTAHRVPV